MSRIYLDEGCKLKSFRSSTNGAKSVLRVEIEISDPLTLGFFLRDLAEIQREQAQAAKPKKKPLGLPFYPEGN